jgi:hypothetical protein
LNARKSLALLIGLVGVLAFAWTVSAADLIGDWGGGNLPYGYTIGTDGWNGGVQTAGTVKAGSGYYINYYGSNKDMVTLWFWNAAVPWATGDSTHSDSTGTLMIADWQGDKALVKIKIAGKAAGYPQKIDAYWQTKHHIDDAWTSVKTLITSGTDTLATFTCDTIDFTDPAMRAPFGRLYFTPTASGRNNMPAKILSVIMDMFRNKPTVLAKP